MLYGRGMPRPKAEVTCWGNKGQTAEANIRAQKKNEAFLLGRGMPRPYNTTAPQHKIPNTK